jgi:hypothetical protein
MVVDDLNAFADELLKENIHPFVNTVSTRTRSAHAVQKIAQPVDLPSVKYVSNRCFGLETLVKYFLDFTDKWMEYLVSLKWTCLC